MKKSSQKSETISKQRQRNYRVRYSIDFYNDLKAITDYITLELKNPDAAFRLVDSVEAAINTRRPFAESFERFDSKYQHKYDYYRIYVGNFIVFYVVIDEGDAGKVMEIRRLLYAKSDAAAHI